MKIIFDAMGGDNAPLEILKGSVMAKNEYGVDLVAVGNEEIIRKVAAENNIDLTGIEIVNTTQTIEMCDEPVAAVRQKKDSSLVVAMQLLAQNKADALVSAGSTGAVLAGATFIVKRIKGVSRPAITIAMPGATKAYVLLDSGANVECRAEMLNAFAVMGSVYAQKVLKRQNPTVGLANNGTEESKGTPLYVQTHKLLKQNKNVNFIGNVEPKEIPFGNTDVIVCDGFVGNIILKLTEGVAKMLVNEIKGVFMKGFLTKIAYLLVKGGMKDFKNKLDADEQGGAIVLGVTKPVIKAHGSSNAKAFKNAIRQAKNCIDEKVVENISEKLASISESENGEKV